MKLGIIGKWSEENFAYVKSLGLEFIEFCYNVGRDTAAFTAIVPELKKWSEQYGVPVGSMGRWGSTRVLPSGEPNEAELASDFALIDAAGELGCPVFNCGVNAVEGASFEQNVAFAAGYLGRLLERGREKGVRIAIYNCDWGNFLFDKRGWDAIFPLLPELGIKYDTSHCINREGDPLAEMLEYGDKILHFHVKGTLRVAGKHVDDPPAGLDQTPWGAVFDLLYLHNYDRTLSIEPHSSVWKTGERGEWGVKFTRDYVRRFIIPPDAAGREQYMP